MVDVKGKKVLVMGLGLLHGGVATTKWLVKHGARVTITDLKTRKELASSIKSLGAVARKVRFVLGGHKEEDFRTHDIVVVNPGVPRTSPFLQIAREAGLEIINDAVVFFDFARNPTVAITGTKGKTTTTTWIAHLLKSRWSHIKAAGNTPENPLLKELERIEALRLRSGNTDCMPVVLELSSWQLELLPSARKAPDLALITNIYEDHLNRYDSMEAYANAKAEVFSRQTPSQLLLLSYEDKWTPYFLAKKPKASIYFFSLYSFPKKLNGLFLRDGFVFRQDGVERRVLSKEFFEEHVLPLGKHNILNLLAAMLVSFLQGIPWNVMRELVPSLPSIPYRQKIVLKKGGLLVINDSTATSPEATSAAIRRFASLSPLNLFLICGGTDKNLSYDNWARVVAKHIPSDRLFLLKGSATEHMKASLRKVGLAHVQEFSELEPLIRSVKERVGRDSIVLFSPGAASFETFLNEFDRGERFTKLARIYFNMI